MIMRCVITNSKFEEFLEDATKDPACGGTPLRELLDTPLLRIPRYKMLVKDLLSCTDTAHPDFQKLATAYNYIKIINEDIVSLRTKEENLKRLSACLSSIQECPVKNLFCFFQSFFFSSSSKSDLYLLASQQPMLLSSPRTIVDELIVAELGSSGSAKRIVRLILLGDALVVSSRPTKKGSSSAPRVSLAKEGDDLPFKFEALVTHSSLFIMESPGNSRFPFFFSP